MAFGTLQEIRPTRPITYRGQNMVNLSILAAAVLIVIVLVIDPSQKALFPILAILALVFGVQLIVPIGGADMPTVISILNSYAGLSGAALGFVLNNKVLIIAGALDGSSGFLLSVIMCRAMNRSFTNVLFGAFGQVQESVAGEIEERGVPAHRRRARGRRQRRHEPRRAHAEGLSHLRDADPQRRPGADRDGDQAEHEPRLRGHRERALLQREDHDAVR